MGKRHWQLGTTFDCDGRSYKVNHICDEPDTGLCDVIETTHPLQISFRVPYGFVDGLVARHRGFA